MDKSIDLTKILKYCPKGFTLYSLLHGEVSFRGIDETSDYPITYDYPIIGDIDICINRFYLTSNGTYSNAYNGECILFPSKDQRDWSKFTAPWLKKERFDPKTLKPFDKVLVRDESYERWKCEFYSYLHDDNRCYPYIVINDAYKHCIPYNDDTKHLVGTTKEAPEYYRYWEE